MTRASDDPHRRTPREATDEPDIVARVIDDFTGRESSPPFLDVNGFLEIARAAPIQPQPRADVIAHRIAEDRALLAYCRARLPDDREVMILGTWWGRSWRQDLEERLRESLGNLRLLWRAKRWLAAQLEGCGIALEGEGLPFAVAELWAPAAAVSLAVAAGEAILAPDDTTSTDWPTLRALQAWTPRDPREKPDR